MKFYPTLQETLAKRFTELDECKDIVDHGIDGGFNGFIYTYELNEFFNEFESEIEDYFYDIYGASWLAELTAQREYGSLDELRTYMVWSVATDFCCRKVELMMEAA